MCTVQVVEAEERESLARKALLQTKQLAADANVAAQAVQETVGSRRNARLMTLDTLMSKRQRLESVLQQLQKAIVGAPASVVNQAVVLFHQQQADSLPAESRQRSAVSPADVLSRTCECQVAGMAAPSSPGGRRGPWLAVRPATLAQDAHSSPASDNSSGGDSLQGTGDNAPPPWQLLHLSCAPCSRQQSASQFAARKVALQALQSWLQLSNKSQRLAVLAEEHGRANRMQCALRHWGRVVSEVHKWRSRQLLAAVTQRTGAVMARALYGWQLFVVLQQELLHRFLKIRCTHARLLQQRALQGLRAYAVRKVRARELVHAVRRQTTCRVLWSWRGVVCEAQDIRTKALLVFANRAHRQLQGMVRAWHTIATLKRRRRRLQLELAAKHTHRQLAEAVKTWRGWCACKSLLRRVFSQAEQAWAAALQVWAQCSAHVFRLSACMLTKSYRVECCSKVAWCW